MSSETAVAPAGPVLRVAGRDIPVVLPRLADPRLRVAAVLLTVQVLGQTVLGFKLSVAQILVTIALLLRATGTAHGDWWSLHGIWFFVLAALVSLAAEYFVRPTGRHIFNPSNVGLVWALWSPEQVSGLFYWTTIVASPETLVFVLFMMSDPVTAPKSARGRVVFGVATSLLAAGLLSFQPTEFGVKLAIIALVAPVGTAQLAGNERIIIMEQGRSGVANPQ